MGTTGSKPSLLTSYCKGPNCDFAGEMFKTIPECLHHFAESKPDKDAVVFCSTVGPRHAISWKELYDRSCKMAYSFVNMGVKQGENVVVTSRNCPEYLYVTFGAMMAGACVVNIVFTYKDGSDFIQAMNKLESCAALVLDPDYNESNWNILKCILDDYDSTGFVKSSRLPFLRKLIFIQPPANENVSTIKELLSEEPYAKELPVVKPDDLAIIFQTSGSTGISKLVVHTHANMTSMGPRVECDAYKAGDIVFNDRPFSWAGGFPFGFFIGQTRVTISGFCPEPQNKASFLINVITKEKCTVAMMLPPMMYDMVERKDELPDDWPLKIIWTGGQPLTKALTACLGTICKCLGTAYGGTEFYICSAVVVTKREDLVDFSSGMVCPGTEVKVVGTDGSVLPLNEIGEIYIRNAFSFKEYLNDPAKTSSVMTSDGWYKTDDYGRLNSGGYLFVEGRISDMIISGGMNVMPSMLETVLTSCPGVGSAVMVPVPDVKMYQTICACVEAEQRCDVTEVQLRQYMETIHNDKQKLFTVLPKYYMILDKFPLGSNGKVSRKKLRTMAEERFAGQA